MSGASLRVHVLEATGLSKGGSVLGGSNVFVALRVDQQACGKSPAVSPVPSARWDYVEQLRCPQGAQNLILEVKRSGLLGNAHYIGGCSIRIDDISVMDNEVLPLFDSSSREIGRLRASIERLDRPSPRPSGLGGGLANQVGPNSARGSAQLSARGSSQLSARGSSQPGTHSTLGALPGGLSNHAGLANQAGAGFHPSASSSFHEPPMGTLGRSSAHQSTLDREPPRTSTYGGLVNHAPDQPPTPSTASAGFGTLARAGTGGLANLASEGDDGTRPNALPRAQELLQELSAFSPSCEDQRQKLLQALENLRRAPEADLRGSAGQAAFHECENHIQAVFTHAIAQKNEKDANGALWLAGRLPMVDDGQDRATLQDRLRKTWDAAKMEEALAKAQGSLGAASASAAGLESFMDELDLAEFHAQQAGKNMQQESGKLLSKLQPHLVARVSEMLAAGQLVEVEAIIGLVGAGRVAQLGLEPARQEVQRRRSLELLQSALWPAPGQIGFPVLKRRQLQLAKINASAAVADDASGETMKSLKALLLKEILPACMAQSKESSEAALQTCFELHLADAEVWAAAQMAYGGLTGERKRELALALPQLCRDLRKDPPNWLLTPQQVTAQESLRGALRQRDNARLQQACQQVIETDGGKEVCQKEMEQAIDRLRKEYKLPGNWDVEGMLGDQSSKLLAKNEVRDPKLLQIFDEIVKKTARPKWTRDRKGGVPQSFAAVKAVEVMNGHVWRDYVQRRDQIAQQCRRMKVRHDRDHWEKNLNGLIMSMDCVKSHLPTLAQHTPLLAEANEAWLLHGTSFVAAESITSEDFDMTRANPHGLFGAGVYFAESVSKSDEYVQGGRIGGREVFPLLLCRVCLGYVYYCDERSPDRRQLERNCIEKEYHSVLGDRVKTSGTFREFIIYDNLQAFPAYIIYYARQFK